MVSKQQGGRRNLRDLFTRESSVRSTNSIKKSSSASSSVRQLSSRTVTSTSANSGDETFPLQTITTTTTTTTTLPCSHVVSPPARRQYRVTFADPVCEDPGESDEEQPEPLSEQERNNYFYNTKDLENFEKDMALTALMYIKRREHGIPWEETTYSIRGVEELLRKHKTNNKSPREEHTKRVMDEQTRLERQQQRHSGGEDDDDLQQQQQQQKMSDRLCLVACQSSKAERLRAMHRAREDAASAGRTASSSRSSGSGSNKRFTMKKMLGVRRLGGGGSSSRSLKSK